MKKNLILGLTLFMLVPTSLLAINAKKKHLDSFEKNIVDCVYTIWVHDRDGKPITGYSVADDELSDIDCLKTILGEVAFLQHKYPEADVTYTFNM